MSAETLIKKPGMMAVCTNCGHPSQSHIECDFCRKVLPENCKYVPLPPENHNTQRKYRSNLTELYPDILEIPPVKVQLGSIVGIPIQNIKLKANKIEFCYKQNDHEHDAFRVSLAHNKLLELRYFLDKRITVFLILVSCGSEVRSGCSIQKIESPSERIEYFDPKSPVQRHRYISLLGEGLEKEKVIHAQSLLSILNSKTTPRAVSSIKTENLEDILKTFCGWEIDMTVDDFRNVTLKQNVRLETKKLRKSKDQPEKKLCLYPPPPVEGGICVYADHAACLSEGEMLNDVIIDFYLKWMEYNIVPEELRPRIHFFSSFFYSRLVQKPVRGSLTAQQESIHTKPAKRRHARVAKWTRNIDIFSKRFLFVPINESQHWYLALICHPALVEDAPHHEPCILVFDSFTCNDRYSVVNILREYLTEEWAARKEKETDTKRSFTKSTFPDHVLHVPQQDNYVDCGIYLLHYVEMFFQRPFSLVCPIEDLSNWFSQKEVRSKRESIQSLIQKLHQEQMKDSYLR